MDPYLQGTPHIHPVRLLTDFAACVRSVNAGQGHQVSTETVSSALIDIGQTIALTNRHNPIKLSGYDKLISCLTQMLDGWHKDNPATAKKLPVKADVPAYLCWIGAGSSESALEAAVGDLTLIAFYYLLRMCEYICKSIKNTLKNSSV